MFNKMPAHFGFLLGGAELNVDFKGGKAERSRGWWPRSGPANTLCTSSCYNTADFTKKAGRDSQAWSTQKNI